MMVRIASSQFTFIEGIATLLNAKPDFAADLSERVRSAPVEDNLITDIEVVGGGANALLISNARVRSSSDGSIHAVQGVALGISLHAQDPGQDVVEIRTGPLALVRLQLPDAGDPSSEIGVAAEGATLEAKADAGGGIDVLLKPGRYSAYVVGASHRGTSFTIDDDVVQTTVTVSCHSD